MLPQGVVDFSAGLGDGIFLGYGDELRDLLGIDGGIDPASDEYRVGFATGVTTTAAVVTRGALRGYRTGHEIRLGSNVRIAPFGNRTSHPIGRYPHWTIEGVLIQLLVQQSLAKGSADTGRSKRRAPTRAFGTDSDAATDYCQ